MVDLEGSEKQVAWANDIRAAAMAQLAEKREAIIAKHVRREAEGKPISRMIVAQKELVACIDEALPLLENESSAKWWIDHRQGADWILMSVLHRDLPTVL